MVEDCWDGRSGGNTSTLEWTLRRTAWVSALISTEVLLSDCHFHSFSRALMECRDRFRGCGGLGEEVVKCGDELPSSRCALGGSNIRVPFPSSVPSELRVGLLGVRSLIRFVSNLILKGTLSIVGEDWRVGRDRDGSLETLVGVVTLLNLPVGLCRAERITWFLVTFQAARSVGSVAVGQLFSIADKISSESLPPTSLLGQSAKCIDLGKGLYGASTGTCLGLRGNLS